MKVNTIMLCACGTSINIIAGYLYALIENNILEKDYNNIKRFIGCSSGSIVALLMSIGIPINVMYNISDRMNYSTLLDINNLDNLFDNTWLFDTINIKNTIDNILEKFHIKKNTTFLELHNKTNNKLIIKVYNLSLNKEVYISYKNYPDMPVSLAICMSSAIPFLFKPVVYNDYLFVDGAINGGTPVIEKYKNYISITIVNSEILLLNNLTFHKYIGRLIQSTNNKYSNFEFNNNKRNVIIKTKLNMSINFSIESIKKKEDLINGYNQTIKHINKYNIK